MSNEIKTKLENLIQDTKLSRAELYSLMVEAEVYSYSGGSAYAFVDMHKDEDPLQAIEKYSQCKFASNVLHSLCNQFDIAFNALKLELFDIDKVADMNISFSYTQKGGDAQLVVA